MPVQSHQYTAFCWFLNGRLHYLGGCDYLEIIPSASVLHARGMWRRFVCWSEKGGKSRNFGTLRMEWMCVFRDDEADCGN